MLNYQEKSHATELLKILSWEDLLSLTRTVTEGFIVPLTSQEACCAILQHTKNTEELLSRQKLTKEVLFNYLHSKNVTFSKSDKQSLKQMIIDLWKMDAPVNYQERTHPSSTTRDLATSQYENNNTTVTTTSTEANQLAEKFTEWFYSLLNQSRSELGGCILGTDNFFPDCSMRMHMQSSSASIENEVENDPDGVLKLLLDTKSDHNLYFNPNLTPDGVQGKMDPHGLVMVAVCGTLHQDQKCAGVFEQLFGLARDPFSANNWKIKYTEVKLKSQDFVTGVPALKDSDLGRTLLALAESNSCI